MEIFASFARYIFRTFIFKATIIILYYVAPQWLFNDAETDDLEWSFCHKIWSELVIQLGWRSGFWRKLFGYLQSYALTVSGKKMGAPHCTGDISVTVDFQATLKDVLVCDVVLMALTSSVLPSTEHVAVSFFFVCYVSQKFSDYMPR